MTIECQGRKTENDFKEQSIFSQRAFKQVHLHTFYQFEIERVIAYGDSNYQLFNLNYGEPKSMNLNFASFKLQADTQLIVTMMNIQLIKDKNKDNPIAVPELQKGKKCLFLLVSTGKSLVCFPYNKNIHSKEIELNSKSETTLLNEETFKNTVGTEKIVGAMFMCTLEHVNEFSNHCMIATKAAIHIFDEN